MGSLRTKIALVVVAVLLLSHSWWYPLLRIFVNLAALSSRWPHSSEQSFISQDHDNFDITFAAYPLNQSTAGYPYRDVVPPIMHHINLGPKKPRSEWMAAREECIKYHPDWQAFIWDDETAEKFVGEKYPHLKHMWDNYHYPVERVDALRYMILQTYGGVVLDFDLSCKRSLGPLRRFDFVAPAAHPTGFSVGFMMSSQGSAFMQELVDNLPIYNHEWFFLPYAAVMFSTGCHYASTIFTLHKNTAALRILGGIPDFPTLHRLNGLVDTPLFRHLGSSSWHSYDASLINWLGHLRKGPFIIAVIIVSFLTSFLATLGLMCLRRRHHIALRRSATEEYQPDNELVSLKEA